MNPGAALRKLAVLGQDAATEAADPHPEEQKRSVPESPLRDADAPEQLGRFVRFQGARLVHADQQEGEDCLQHGAHDSQYCDGRRLRDRLAGGGNN